MPIFGDYETFEEVAVHEQPGHVTTVYKARQLSGRADQVYAVKVFIPHRPPDPVVQSEDELEEDPASSFLEGIKRLKQAQASGGSCLVPVHDFGLTDGGAWFATDYAQRQSVGEFIIRQLKPDSEALRHVVSSVLTGCLALKRATGRSHGSLRPSNILLAGTGPLPLRKTPLQLMDPYPASLSVINKLSPADRQMVSSMLEEALELQDLHCIGELIFQLVEQRMVRGYDYNLPTSTSPAWTGLGKDGEFWRELCLKLLDPNLTLEKVSLESLAAEFPAAKPSKLPLILAGVAVLILLAGGGIVAWKAIAKKGAQAKIQAAANYELAIATAQKAFDDNQWREAVAQAGDALKHKPGDAAATKLKSDAQSRLDTEQSFANALKAGQQALGQGRWQEALAQAGEALKLKPGDAAATKLKNDAQSKLGVEQNYTDAMKAGQEAWRQGLWQEALAHADEALKYKPGDGVATKLKSDAEFKLGAEQNYADAMKAGQEALRQGRWQEAVAQAGEALRYKPGDGAATKLKADAQSNLSVEQNYADAMKAGQDALRQGRWQEALAQAGEALKYKPGDGAATMLKSDAQTKLGVEQNYEDAINAGRAALREGRWQEALTQAGEALKLKPGDATATTLKSDAQFKLNAERDYAVSIQAGQAAYGKGQWQQAWVRADDALKLRPGDATAAKLKNDAQAKLDADRNYAASIQAGQSAYGKGQWQEALVRADEALKLKPGDATATKLKNDAQSKLDAERDYAVSMQAGKAAYGEKQWQEALVRAGEALKLKPRDAEATQLVKDAQQQIDLARTAHEQEQYEEAIAAGQKAFAEGQWQVAESQADAALNLKPSDPKALTLKQESRRALDLVAAKTSFDQGNSAAARALCEQYASVDAFQELLKRIKAFDAGSREFNSGVYSFVELWKNEGYANEKPFNRVFGDGESENAALVRLQSLTSNPANRATVVAELANVSAAARQKPPFQQVQAWVDANDPEQQLAGFLTRLEQQVEAAVNTGRAFDENPYYDQVGELRKRFKAMGNDVLKKYQDRLKKIETTLNNY